MLRQSVRLGWMRAVRLPDGPCTPTPLSRSLVLCGAPRQTRRVVSAVRGRTMSTSGGGGGGEDGGRTHSAGSATTALPAERAAIARTAGTALGRTHYCGVLRESDEGAEVTLCGWIQKSRVFNQSLAFVTLRDCSGVIQVGHVLASLHTRGHAMTGSGHVSTLLYTLVAMRWYVLDEEYYHR